MSWIDPAAGWNSDECVVCGESSKRWVAPMGIVSGRVRCHWHHSDQEILLGYLQWLERQAQAADRVERLAKPGD